MPWACYGLTLDDVIVLCFEYIEVYTVSEMLCYHFIFRSYGYFHFSFLHLSLIFLLF